MSRSRTTPGRSVVLRAASTAWLHRTVNAACGLVVLPLIVAHLSRIEFGIWVLATQAISFLSVADAGSSNAVGRLIAKYRGLRQPEGVSRVITTTFLISVAAALVTIPMVALLAWGLPRWAALSGATASEAAFVVWITGSSLAVQIALRSGVGILTGHQMYGVQGIGKLLESVLTLLVVVVLARNDALRLTTLAWGTAVSAVIAQAVLMIAAWRMTHPWGMSLQLVSRHSVTEVIGLGSSMLTVSLGTLAQNQGLGLIVAGYAGVAAGGLFGASLIVIANVQPLISSFAVPLSTLASEWQASESREALRRMPVAVMRVTTAVAAVAFVSALHYAHDGVRILLAPESWEPADVAAVARSVILMSAGVLVGAPVLVLRLTLQGTGRHWLVAVGLWVAVVMTAAIAAASLRNGAGWLVVSAAWGLVWVGQGAVFLVAALRQGIVPPLPNLARTVVAPALLVAAITYLAVAGLIRLSGRPATKSELGWMILVSGGLGLLAILVVLRPRLRAHRPSRSSPSVGEAGS